MYNLLLEYYKLVLNDIITNDYETVIDKIKDEKFGGMLGLRSKNVFDQQFNKSVFAKLT